MKNLLSSLGIRIFVKAFAFQIFIWLGIFFLGFELFTLTEILLGSVFLAGAAGVASYSVESERKTPEPDNGWRFLYLLLTERRTMLIMAAGTVALSLLAAWKFSESKLALEYSENAGFAVRLASQTIYYEPVSPYGWQDTRIEFKKGDRFKVTVTGRVSPGFLRGFEYLEANLEAMRAGSERVEDPNQFQWKFVGPEGYSRAWYASGPPVLQEGYDNSADHRLTVQGLPHAKLVGIILDSGEEPRRAGERFGEANYTAKDLSGETEPYLLDFSASREDYPLEFVAKTSGYLWVTINDADEFRWDNAGMFFLRVVK